MAIILPDLGAPLPALPALVFRAFERTGFVALPGRLGLDTEVSTADGSRRPVFLLTLLRGSSGATGRLDLGLTIDADLPAIGRGLAEAGEPGQLALAEPESGVLALRATLGPVAPSTLAEAQSLPPDILGRARITTELSAAAAALAARLVEDATLPAEATLRLAFRGVAPRLPLVLSFDPRIVADKLAERLGAGASVTMQAFGACLDTLLAAAVLTTEAGDVASIDPQLRASTLALRLRDRFTRTETSSVETELRLQPPDVVPRGHERLDLGAPTVVVAERRLAMDPFAAARLSLGGELAQLVRRIDIPPLSFGQTRLALAANLPEPIPGMAALFADIRAPEAPPFRPQPVVASVRLDPPERRGTIGLELAPGETLRGEARLRTVVTQHGQGVELAGPWRAVTASSEVVLGPDLFPLPLVTIRLSPALAALASVEVMAAGETLTTLDAAQPAAAVPRPTPDTALNLAVRPIGGGQAIALTIDAPSRRCDLDVATLPGFGAHRAQVIGQFAPGERPVMVEWRAEDQPADAPILSVRLGPDRPEAEIGWFAASPFRSGIVWRLVRDGVPGAWSAPVPPAATGHLNIEISERPDMDADKTPVPVVIEGVELRPDAADPTTWIYLPPSPSLERQGGAPQLSLIEAGPVAFLQATSRVDLPEDMRTRLLQRLQQDQPTARAVRAVPLTVQRVALELRTGDGTWRPLVEGTSSGTPPWQTALSATPDAASAAAVKAAIAGQRDRLRLSVRLAVAASPAVEGRRTFAAEATATARQSGAPGVSFTASVAADVAGTAGGSAETIIEQVRDVADFFA